MCFNPLNAELNPICHLLALLEAHQILHVSRIRVNVNFILLKTIHVHLLVCYLNKLQNARCNDKDSYPFLFNVSCTAITEL